MGRPKDGKHLIVRKGYIAGLPVSAIAELAGISEGSVRVRAHRMGLQHPKPQKPRGAMRFLNEEQKADYLRLTGTYRYRSAEALRMLGVAQ